MIQLYAVCKRLTYDPRHNSLKMKGWKKIFHANSNERGQEWLFYQKEYTLNQKDSGDFNGPVVESPPSNAGDVGLIPGQGAVILHVMG